MNELDNATRPHASVINIGGSLAGLALRMDPFWSVEPTWAQGALITLLQTNAAQHQAAYREQGAILSFAAGMLAAQSVKENKEASETDPQQTHQTGWQRIADSLENQVLLTGRNVADTSGTHRVPFGQNADGSRKPYPIDGGVALMAITGPMTKEDAPSMEEGTSTVRARRLVRQAKSDGDVKAVLIRFYTPGGQVSGNDDLARDIADLAQVKPTYAYVEDLCASAGYYCAAQCNAIYANPSSLIGSIATVMTFMDYSKMLEIAGIFVDVITPPDAPFKGAGTPGTALTPEQRAYYQDLCVTFAAQFRSAVKRGRGLSDEQMKAVSDGRVFPAAQARSLKLIDGITSYDNVLNKLKTYRAPASPA